LASLCRELDERGIRWAVSNSDTPFVREIYKKFSLIPIANRREINLNSQNRGIDELLIVNYRPPRQNLLPFDD
jgi:DNA adenine methylase